MSNLISKLHNTVWLGKIFHTLDYCLQKELRDCESVLDLGCGPSSPLQHCQNIKYSVGVEAFAPYLEETKKKNIHTEYIHEKIEEIDFPEKSFDAVIMIEVLEHLPENIGLEMLQKVKKWAGKKVIVSSPNGFINQREIDNNPWQEHLSGWDYKKMKGLSFKCNGLAGLKILRQEIQSDTMGDDLETSIKFRPRLFWFVIASLSQIFTFYFPKKAFELFSVIRIK